jgi:hypothetical protein
MSGRPPDAVSLRDILDELRLIRQAIERPRPESSLSRTDRETLTRLLPAIGGAVGSELFSSAEICEHDAAGLRLVCAGLTVKQLGRLLARAADQPISGYMVLRESKEAGAVLWRVVQVPEFPRVQKPFRSSRDTGRSGSIDAQESLP